MPFCLLQAAVMTDTSLDTVFVNIDVLHCHTLYLAKKKPVYSSHFKVLLVGYSELLVSRTGSIQSVQKPTCQESTSKTTCYSEFQLKVFRVQEFTTSENTFQFFLQQTNNTDR